MDGEQRDEQAEEDEDGGSGDAGARKEVDEAGIALREGSGGEVARR